ncbi:uncharacterized protein B0H18DRAFT_1087329 [Fomitopsis serialis]|uniref:uncharacterized protein n=1 Tax=Fomitopsis serialis TaxID=139415 RepID=UPI00200742EC|nr:uncharacterized protein B0H18DRAFT_1087329 [Neoantrodia serialis]KAH9916435.1 hypothetical protein B0H18DRAFT_1087329 [Neoantrodia serialis]
MAMQLQERVLSFDTYSLGGFKEGVSLTCDDELNRWQKYAYGCNELPFNPIARWYPLVPLVAPLHYKFSMMSYMFSYYGIACSITISVINYICLGFELPIWLATTVVFIGSGGYTLLQYLWSFLINVMWIPYFQAIIAHLFSHNISWGAKKEVERSIFFEDIPKILKRA